MPQDVFISYAHSRRADADRIAAALEEREIGVWMAPRDILAGEEWAEAIMGAIDDCRLFLLVLSAESVASGQVLREVKSAADRADRIPIVAVWIERVELTRGLAYYLGPVHWFDKQPIDDHLDELAAAIQTLLSDGGASSRSPLRERGRSRKWRRRGLIMAAVASITAAAVYVTQGIPGPEPSITAPREFTEKPVPEPIVAAPETVHVEPPPIELAMISFASTPPGAEVWMNRERVGVTPDTLRRVDPGIHEVEVVLAGHETFRRAVRVDEGGASHVEAKLDRLTGRVRMEDPQGGTAYLGTQVLGTAPFIAESVPIGTHEITVRRRGYAEYRGTIDVKAGSELALTPELVPLETMLTIRVLPFGSVIVDNERLSEDSNAPVSLPLPTGKHDVVAWHPSWGRWPKTIEMNGVDADTLRFDFGKTYRVKVVSVPSRAEIWVDGQFIDKYTPVRLSLRPGERAIAVRKDGYEESREVRLVLEDDVADPIRFELRSTP